jgi:DNA-binding beta-propeller fold protein YncE
MVDLRDRFEALGRAQTPDLWREIEGREPRPLPSQPGSRRAFAIAVALLIGMSGLVFAGLTFGGSEAAHTPMANGQSAANGPIFFRVGGGEGGTRIESIQADGTGRRVVFPEDSPVHYERISFSPDGSRIAFDNYLVDGYGIETANPDGTEIARLTDGANDSWASWSPDGSKILFSSTRYDPSVEGCEPGFPHEFQCPTDIYVMDEDGSNIVRLTDDPAGEFMPVWSPQGDQIAFVREGDLVAGTHEAVYTMRPDGSDVRQVSSADGGSDFWPSWSPDGTQIVFGAIRNEDWGIWVVDADGSNEHPIFGGVGMGYVNNPVWSPDGRLIAFVGNQIVDDYSPDDALYVMRPDGSDITPLADAPGVGVAGDIAWQPIPASQSSVGPPPPLSAEVVDTFPVGEDVRSVAYGDGSVWVAMSNGDGTFAGRIVRIDPETHEIQAEIPVDVIPTWEVGGGAMVFEDGSLWVTGGIDASGSAGPTDAAVTRIDTTANEVVHEFTLGGETGADLAFLDGDLWVLLFGDDTVEHRMEILRVDPATGDVAARVALQAGWAHTIVAADDRLVVLEAGKGGTNVDGAALAIDPATNTIGRADIPSGTFVPMPVISRGQVWVGLEPGFARFDPQSGAFPETPVTLDRSQVSCCGFLEADDRGIWFLSPDPQGGSGQRLMMFDPASGEVTNLTVSEGTPVAMAVAPNAVWILNYEGTLTHVELG